MENGIIEIDSERGLKFGLTSDRYMDQTYLWKKDNDIYLSFIATKGTGNLRYLCENILKQGFRIKVPTPMGIMYVILAKWGFEPTFEDDEHEGQIEVWVKEKNGTLTTEKKKFEKLLKKLRKMGITES